MKFLFVVPLLATSLAAQLPSPQTPKPIASPRALAAASAALTAKDLLLFDEPHAGEHWVVGTDYKASFDHDGIGFFAAPASVAEESPSARLHISASSVGGVSLRFASPAPQRHDRRFSWDRGPFVETVDVRPDAIGQSFVFATLPNRGELVLELAVTGSAPGADRGDGFVLAGGAIAGTEAVAIDANGARVTAPTVLDGDRLTIRVPAEFVARAALPLVVDPLYTSTVVHSNSLDLGNADLAWDRGSASWTVVYERRFAVNDTDVYAARLDAAFQLIGNTVSIDSSTNVWQLPAIANMDGMMRHLVVAQVSVDDIGPYWIGGRVVDGAGPPLSVQLDIEKAGLTGHASGDKIHPDVGGDPGAGIVYWTVVWERVFSTSDHDIHMKQVNYDGTLRSAAPTLLANDTAMDTAPSISKSDGPGSATQRRFLVAWSSLAAVNDHDILGALLTWDGQRIMVGNSNILWIDDSFADEARVDVSSPSDGSLGGTGDRFFVCTYERTNVESGHIVAGLVRTDGWTSMPFDVTAANWTVPTTWPQSRPRVDCDGQRYTIAYQTLYHGAGTDQDIRSVILAASPAGFAIAEPTWLVGTGFPELTGGVASVYSSTGHRSSRVGISNQYDDGSTNQIQVQGYDAYVPGVFGWRTTSCGSLHLTTSGNVGLGQLLQFGLDSTHPLTGFLVGFPTSSTTPSCPGCVLGVNGTTLLGNQYALQLPFDVGFVGITLSVQGFTFGGGPCAGTVSLSDTVDCLLL